MALDTLPITHQDVIPTFYLDEMGHMNVMWYMHLFSCGTAGLFKTLGFNDEYFKQTDSGAFALEAHVRYHAEIRAGQHVTLRTRMIGRSEKRFHFLHYLYIDESDILAATCETVGAHMDMTVRRMSAIPHHIKSEFDRAIAEHAALLEPPPVCGVMKP